MKHKSQVTLFKSSFCSGGVERVFINLANGFADASIPTQILTCDTNHPYFEDLRDSVELIPTTKTNATAIIDTIQKHLLDKKPSHLITANASDNQLALAARNQTKVKCKIIASIHWISSAQIEKRNFISRWWKIRTIRRQLEASDQLIAVSRGVALDLQSITKRPLKQIPIIHNPVVHPELYEKAAKPVTHPWLKNNKLPVILGAGRFTRGKDFATLIKAFAILQQTLPSQLILLGEGRQLKRLKQLGHDLNISDKIDFPGFTNNPFNYMKNADLFVLSSKFEGFGLVLAEALALGTPVVSTDCPTGPREILQDGKYGSLTPVGDASELANAMMKTLSTPTPHQQLEKACASYTLTHSIERYIEILGINR